MYQLTVKIGESFVTKLPSNTKYLDGEIVTVEMKMGGNLVTDKWEAEVIDCRKIKGEDDA